MDRIAAMNVFVRVVEAGTFTKAAETLNLPKSTVTRLVQQLESNLQVKLLRRTTRMVTVTPEGEAYRQRISQLLAELADIESTTRLRRGRLCGIVRLEAPPVVAANVIVPALADFHQRYPDVQVEIKIGNRPIHLMAEGVDCSIRFGNIEEQLMVSRRVGEFRFSTCAAPSLLEMHAAPKTPEELRNLPTIGMEYGRSGKPIPFRFTQGSNLTELVLRHKFVVDDNHVYVAAGVAGLGFVQAPAFAATTALKEGLLVPVLSDWGTKVIPVTLLYAPNRYLNATVRVCIDWLAALFEHHEQFRRS